MRSVNLMDDHPSPVRPLPFTGAADLAAALVEVRRQLAAELAAHAETRSRLALECESHRTAGLARDRYLRLLWRELGRRQLEQELEAQEMEDARRLTRHEAD